MREGESVEVQGSARLPYTVKKVGGVVSCSCPAWRNQRLPIDQRMCKHSRPYLPGGVASGGLVPIPTPATPPQPLPSPLLAHTWDGEQDVSGWWASEKLDGVRALWTGTEFRSREGNVYHAPEWFKAQFPRDLMLDGELWAGRKQFQRLVSIVRKGTPSDEEWAVTFIAFDAPAVPGPVEVRWAAVERAFVAGRAVGNRYGQVWVPHSQSRVGSNADVRKLLALVDEMKGEGVMLRKPGSLYESRRSNTLLKVKTFHDAEATVIGHEPGKGRHKGYMGALRVYWNGVEFKVGTGFSDREREQPPPVGSVITFRYQELSTGGIPRFPSFVAVRNYE